MEWLKVQHGVSQDEAVYLCKRMVRAGHMLFADGRVREFEADASLFKASREVRRESAQRILKRAAFPSFVGADMAGAAPHKNLLRTMEAQSRLSMARRSMSVEVRREAGTGEDAALTAHTGIAAAHIRALGVIACPRARRLAAALVGRSAIVASAARGSGGPGLR